MSLTRARSPSCKNGLPDLRLLPRCPRPGRSHRTHPPGRQRARGGSWSRKASAAFHTHHERDRSVEPATAQSDQDQRTLPQREAARKLIYLAITNAVPAWTQTRNWTTALLAFKIHFGDRLPE